MTIADQLDRVTPAYDALVADARAGDPMTPAMLHELEERGQAIAAAIVAAFRRPSKFAPVAPPLWQRGGRAIW